MSDKEIKRETVCKSLWNVRQNRIFAEKASRRAPGQTPRCGCQSGGHIEPSDRLIEQQRRLFRAVLRTRPLGRNSNETRDIHTASACRLRTPSSSGASRMTPERA